MFGLTDLYEDYLTRKVAQKEFPPSYLTLLKDVMCKWAVGSLTQQSQLDLLPGPLHFLIRERAPEFWAKLTRPSS